MPSFLIPYRGIYQAMDPRHTPETPSPRVRDPVSGMTVDRARAPHRVTLGDTTHYFCSARCAEKFKADPQRYLGPRPKPKSPETQKGTKWTCPMHPEIVRDRPGSCPICGMALEP